MPEYEFEAKDGSRVSELLPMSEAPKFGAKIVRDGKAYFRVPSLLARPIVEGFEQMGLRQLAPWDPRATHFDTDGSITGMPGRPLATNMKAVDEICAKSEGELTHGYRKFDRLKQQRNLGGPAGGGRNGPRDALATGRGHGPRSVPKRVGRQKASKRAE